MDQSSYGQKPANGTTFRNRTPAAVKFDNLVRSKLRVSNPNDPAEIAEGLKRFYTGAGELTRLEESGMPFYRVPQVQEPQRDGSSNPTNVDLAQAKDDVAKDLNSLLGQALLKDIHPELRGWQSAIDNIIADGVDAAPLALDPGMRDRGFQARRLLGDYARVARFVGALTPALNPDYRALAQSLDEVASVIMVMMGDALANVGFNGGRFLLQASASDLQDRRDTVLVQFRNLVGTTPTTYYGDDTYARGLQAYQQLLKLLDDTGNADLRALLQEANLARLMDDLIARVNVMSADGLRALGSTALLQVQQLRRLIAVGRRITPTSGTPSAPLANFLEALRFFDDAFTNAASGSRLIHVSRPPIVFYGLYGASGLDDPTKTLFKLIVARGDLAVALDCFLASGIDCDKAGLQIILDKLLYDLDRAIDAYSLGTGSNDNRVETRAIAFGLLMNSVVNALAVYKLLTDEGTDSPKARFAALNLLYSNSASVFRDDRFKSIRDPLCDAIRALLSRFDNYDPIDVKVTDGDVTTNNNNNKKYVAGLAKLNGLTVDERALISRELCLQRDAEGQWLDLIRSLAPSCCPPKDRLAATATLVEATLAANQLVVAGAAKSCEPIDVLFPSDMPSALDLLASEYKPPKQ